MRNRIDIVQEEPISVEKSAEAEGDAELVRRAQQGEKEAFATLVSRHEKRVYWIVQGILQNQADAEEVLQESFLKAMQHIGGFRGEARFSTWLIQITINEARMRQRKYRAGLYDSLDEPRDDPSDFRPRELVDWRANPKETMANEEMGLLLQRAVRSLPPIYREVFLLRDAEQFSNEETAGALGISTSATKTRLLQARLMMREFLAPHFKLNWRERLLARVKRRGRSRAGGHHDPL